jgi:hypothetical protein
MRTIVRRQPLSACVCLIPRPKQYAIRKSKTLLGLVGPEAEQKLLSELDSSLNAWADSVPEHRAFHPRTPASRAHRRAQSAGTRSAPTSSSCTSPPRSGPRTTSCRSWSTARSSRSAGAPARPRSRRLRRARAPRARARGSSTRTSAASAGSCPCRSCVRRACPGRAPLTTGAAGGGVHDRDGPPAGRVGAPARARPRQRDGGRVPVHARAQGGREPVADRGALLVRALRARGAGAGADGRAGTSSRTCRPSGTPASPRSGSRTPACASSRIRPRCRLRSSSRPGRGPYK